MTKMRVKTTMQTKTMKRMIETERSDPKRKKNT